MLGDVFHSFPHLVSSNEMTYVLRAVKVYCLEPQKGDCVNVFCIS